MGITIVQKSDLKKPKKNATKALILAGGAVTGGSFKVGGIKALNDYFTNFKVTDFDLYVGISSGSLIAAPLMGGISPESILRSLDGTSRHFTQLKGWHYYRPNFLEWIARPLEFFVKAVAAPIEYLLKGGHMDFPELLSILPSGVFDNSPIEEYLRANIEHNNLTNDFKTAERLTKKRLYICAMELDGARRVVFGPDEKSDVMISEAVQASTAMPGFYKPAHIRGVDYVDGGVQETADIDIAVEKGADLIVCYNPFRPYDPTKISAGMDKTIIEAKAKGRMAQSGVIEVLNQIFRAFFHARLHMAMDRFREDPSFKGDIILIEPRADDSAFFRLNPLIFSNRIEAARLGFESVRNSIEARFSEVKKIFGAYGIELNKRGVEAEFKKISKPNVSETELLALLEGKTKVKQETVIVKKRQTRKVSRRRGAKGSRP